MAYDGQTAHIGCAFSLVEILSHLYSNRLKYNAKDSNDPDRDYLILSKGHGAMPLYAIFHEIGWIDEEDIKSYCKNGSRLHGLCEAGTPGIEASTGSLGHGLPIATGMAYGLKRDGKPNQVYCIVGDGEMQEGSNWEAIAFAAKHRLNNLTVIIDSNSWQAMDRTKEIDPGFLGVKFMAFDWIHHYFDGHNIKAFDECLNYSDIMPYRPRAYIARTLKGKGVSFMEDDNLWHYQRLTKNLYDKAVAELG